MVRVVHAKRTKARCFVHKSCSLIDATILSWTFNSAKLTHLGELQGSVSDGIQVRWGLVSSSVSVMGSHDGSVHHQPLVGVDTDAKETRVGVDLKDLVARPQIVKDAGPMIQRK